MFFIYGLFRSSLSVSHGGCCGLQDLLDITVQNDVFELAVSFLLLPCVQAVEYEALVVALFPLHFGSVLKEYPPLSSSNDQRPQASVSACVT